jgi:hypothetical protein
LQEKVGSSKPVQLTTDNIRKLARIEKNREVFMGNIIKKTFGLILLRRKRDPECWTILEKTSLLFPDRASPCSPKVASTRHEVPPWARGKRDPLGIFSTKKTIFSLFRTIPLFEADVFEELGAIQKVPK